MSWIKALSKAIVSDADEVPKEWKTTTQIAKEIGKSRRSASTAISILIEKKLVEIKKFKIISNGMYATPVNHYKLKKGVKL
jgi:hypothetical protein